MAVKKKNVIKKKSTAFLLSDFIEPKVSVESLRDSLRLTNKKHDLVSLVIQDKGEYTLPDIGLAQVVDPETGKKRWVDTSSKKLRRSLESWWNTRNDQLRDAFLGSGVDFAVLNTDEEYVKPLIKLFQKRGSR